jgi:tRNA(Arg) A34 adenosine deaminase TadA
VIYPEVINHISIYISGSSVQCRKRRLERRTERIIELRVLSTAVNDFDFDGFDHEAHLREAFELARTAAARGDEPFGSVLVRDDTVVMSESNRVNTESDIRRHPELHLAHRACNEYEPEERVGLVMYTSTEPCPMCAGGIARAGLGGVVYSVGADEIAAFQGTEPSTRAAEILGDVSVVGPLLNDEGRRIHEEFGW